MYFERKDRFQQHMGAYRELRNCVQHIRQPSDIELKQGEVGILWLQRILDKYDQEMTLVVDPAEEEELVTGSTS